MKQINGKYGFIVLLSGLAIIAAGFFLLVSEEKRDEIFWLNLVVACFMFTVNLVFEFGIINTGRNDGKVAGLGIRLIYIRFYSIVAIAVIIAGYATPLKFNLQVFLQLAAVFLLIAGYFLSHVSSTQAALVSSEQSKIKKGKEDIINEINQVEIFIARDASKFENERQRIKSIKNTVRYLSPTNDLNATALDQEIKLIIQQAYSVIKKETGDNAELTSLLNKCESLLKLRKNTYSH